MDALIRYLFSIFLVCVFAADCLAETPGTCINSDEAELLQLVDEYRVDNGLAKVPWSQSLMTVGQWHAVDAATNGDVIFDEPCNLHSWSDTRPDLWTGMCYTDNHAQAELMWSKPSEITGGIFTTWGVENGAWGYSSVEAALAAWKKSSGHRVVILNQDNWSKYTWRSMGVGVDLVTHYYYLWFSTGVDPQGNMPLCSDDPPVFTDSFE